MSHASKQVSSKGTSQENSPGKGRKEGTFHIRRWIIGPLIAVLLITLLTPLTRSMIFMSVYSRICANDGLLEDAGVQISIPSGKGWYPFVMTFEDDTGFSIWSGKPSRLEILYNFPAFTSLFGHTRAFEENSPYTNGFYGAYAVRNEDGTPFGFTEGGMLNASEIGLVPHFDFACLVLSDFGIAAKDVQFDWEESGEQDHVTLCEIDGWTKVTANLTVSGMPHVRNRFVPSYIQYGFPSKSIEGQDFAPVQMQGIVYARYLPEKDISIFFYGLAADAAVLSQIDQNFLQRSSIRGLDFSD